MALRLNLCGPLLQFKNVTNLSCPVQLVDFLCFNQSEIIPNVNETVNDDKIF